MAPDELGQRAALEHEGDRQHWRGAAEHERVWRSMRRRRRRHHSGGRVVAIDCTLGYPTDPMSRPTLTQYFSGSIHEGKFTFLIVGYWVGPPKPAS
jgi:hypothetical protein